MRLGFIMKDARNIKASQIIQESVGHVIIRIVPDKFFCEEDGCKVVRAIHERVGSDNLDVKLEVTTLDGLIYTSRGKFKYIVSKIS